MIHGFFGTVSFCIAQPELELWKYFCLMIWKDGFTGMNPILMNIYIIYYFLNLFFIYL